MALDTKKRNLIASALLVLAKKQKMYVRVRLSELPGKSACGPDPVFDG